MTSQIKEKRLHWNCLLSEKRARKSTSHAREEDGRNAFEKDYHRIILSASFRRLQDKTQVFPLDQSDFVRTRLTHSLEVSSLAKSLGERVSTALREQGHPLAPTVIEQNKMSDILLCAGLLHDIGNPPFGHYGETTIRDWYKNHIDVLFFRNKPLNTWLTPQMVQDLVSFEGNAQAIRLVSKLHYLVDEHGMNLTYGLLNTLIKYPVSSLHIDSNSEDVRYHKMGYFLADEELFKSITENTGTALFEETSRLLERQEVSTKGQMSFASDSGLIKVSRHPLTYLMEAADDICYRTADLEDASRKGKITFGQLRNYLHSSKADIVQDSDILEKYQDLLSALDRRYEWAKEKNNQNPELYAIQNWIIFAQNQLIDAVVTCFCENYDEIMDGKYLYDLFHENYAGLLLDVFGNIAYDYVFTSQSIVQLEVAADAIIGGLLNKFVPACLNFDTELEQKPVNQRLMDLISDNYRACYKREAIGKEEPERLYLRLLLVNDYICGMTDSFAKDLYHKFNGIY